MTIEQFAVQHKLKARRDDCNDPIICGKVGHIYEGYSTGLLGIYVDAVTPRAWTDPSLLSQVINERREANPELRSKLAAALNVSERWLFSRRIHVRYAPDSRKSQHVVGTILPQS